LRRPATDGRVTQAQADERLADLTQRVTNQVNSTGPVGGRGDHGAGAGQQPSSRKIED